MKRRLWDRYPTESWATEILLDNVPICGSVFEPCVGDGDIAKVVDKYRVLKPETEITGLFTNDVDRSITAEFHHDLSLPESWELLPKFSWIVTNPPFTLALPILQGALANARLGVAFLLRLSFLEPVSTRAVFLRDCPPDQMVVLPRMSFTGDGGKDMVTCAWFIWYKAQMSIDRHIKVMYPEPEMFDV